jgi:hypothetical protein
MIDKALELTRNVWLKAQLEAPPSVQRTVIPHLHEAKEIVRLLVMPYLPVYQLQGQGQGGPLAVTYIGLQFAKPFLKDLLFTEEPQEQKVKGIPFWRRRELLDLFPSDIVIVEAAEHLIRRLPRHNAMVLPHFIRHVVDVRGDWQDVQRRFHKTVRKNELRWIRKYGYKYDLSYARGDFEYFYHQMYLPTMKDRHGKLALPMSFGEAYQYFRHGWLFRVHRAGDWTSGMVCHLQQNTIMAQVLGVKDADVQLITEGVIGALYYAAIHWANQNGYEAVNFLGTNPFLAIGVFQHKRKWGAMVRVPSNLHRQIWIRIRHHTPAVSQFLKENPCIVVDEDGELHGLIIVDDLRSVSAGTKEEWERRYSTPGLSSLLIRSVNDFAQELVIPILPDPGFRDGL